MEKYRTGEDNIEIDFKEIGVHVISPTVS
jgi:hypothetical protein